MLDLQKSKNIYKCLFADFQDSPPPTTAWDQPRGMADGGTGDWSPGSSVGSPSSAMLTTVVTTAGGEASPVFTTTNNLVVEEQEVSILNVVSRVF